MEQPLKRTNYKHGHASGGRSPTYKSWSIMKSRRYNNKNISFKYYGARNITVCQRWLNSFANFVLDMGERPDGCTLDRKNSNGNYEASNCRWVTASCQARNRRNNKRFTFRGETYCLKEWAERLGFNYYTLVSRVVRYNWPIERAFTEPPAKYDSKNKVEK